MPRADVEEEGGSIVAETITRCGWPDTSIDDGLNLYLVEEKSSEDDPLREDQVKKAAQLLRFGLSILIKIKVVDGECIEPPPAYARVVSADSDGQFYGRGPWDDRFPPRAGQEVQVYSLPNRNEGTQNSRGRGGADFRRVENLIVRETWTIPQIAERTDLSREQVIEAMKKRTRDHWWHWFLMKFDLPAGTYHLQVPDGVGPGTTRAERKVLVRNQAPHQSKQWAISIADCLR